MTAATASPVLLHFRRRAVLSLALPALALAYLFYAALAFDLPGVTQRLRWVTPGRSKASAA